MATGGTPTPRAGSGGRSTKPKAPAAPKQSGRRRAPSPQATAASPGVAGGGDARTGSGPGSRSGGGGVPEATTRSTPDRILDAALTTFGSKGFDATSLDALAGELGITKQTILYWFPSKEALLDAVIDRTSTELIEVLERTLVDAGSGFARIEAIVRAVFRLALRRPELLGLLREVGRLGAAPATRFAANLDPLVVRAREFMEAEMDAGTFRPADARLLLLTCYSTVIGVATEVEVLRALGVEPTMRSLAIRRRQLLDFLAAALVAPPRTRRSARI